MKLQEAQEYLAEFNTLWAVAAIGVNDKGAGPMLNVAPNGTFSPVLLYAFLQVLRIEIAEAQKQLIEILDDGEARERFMSQVRRALNVVVEATLAEDVIRYARETGWDEDAVSKLEDRIAKAIDLKHQN